jgi:hypothetical protein
MEITIPLETVAVVCGGVGLVSYLIRRCERRMKDYVNDKFDTVYDNLYSTDDEINRRIDDEIHSLRIRIAKEENSKVSQLNG